MFRSAPADIYFLRALAKTSDFAFPTVDVSSVMNIILFVAAVVVAVVAAAVVVVAVGVGGPLNGECISGTGCSECG